MSRSLPSRATLVAVWLFAVTTVSIVLRLRAPAWLWADYGHDDEHFAKLAGSILDGDWLGNFDRLTLAKGPGYPIFIAGVYKAHLPLMLTEHVLHLVAAAVVALAVWRITRSRFLGVACYSSLALDPAFLGATGSRVTRDNVYATLAMLLVASTVLFVTMIPAIVRRGLARTTLAIAVSGPALGLIGIGYYLMREERPWLAPALAVGVAAGVTSWSTTRRSALQFVSVALATFLIAGATVALGRLWVVQRNERDYGAGVVSDLVDGNIARAYEQWQRVRAGDQVDYVPVTRDQRRAVYAVSPAAAELRSALEDPANGWRDTSCADRPCDFPGGGFVWAMRDAAQQAGHMTSGREAQAFFGAIADDINDACGKTLRCSAHGLGPLPPARRLDAGRIWTSSVGIAQYLLSYDAGEPERAFPSEGIDPSWRTMLRPLRGVSPRDQDAYAAAEARSMRHQEAVSALTDLYRWTARIAVVPALLGLLLGVATRVGRQRPAAIVLAASMLTAVLSRIALLGVIDATDFGTASAPYVIPGVGFLLVFILIGCWLLVRVIADFSRHRISVGGREPCSDAPEPVSAA